MDRREGYVRSLDEFAKKKRVIRKRFALGVDSGSEGEGGAVW